MNIGLLNAAIVAVGGVGAALAGYAIILVGIRKKEPRSPRIWGRAAQMPHGAFSGYFGATGLAILTLMHYVLYFRADPSFGVIAPGLILVLACLLVPRHAALNG